MENTTLSNSTAQTFLKLFSQRSYLDVVQEPNLLPKSVRGTNDLLQRIKSNDETLQVLYIVDDILGSEQLPDFVSALKINQTIHTLILNIKKLRDDGATLLGEIFKTNKSITALCLYACGIGDRGAIELAQALKENLTLEGLFLPGNKFLSKGVEAVGEMLTVNKKIKILSLEGAIVKSSSLKNFYSLLRKNRCLEVLILGRNQLNFEDATFIARYLINNTTLKSLDLSSCFKGNTGAAVTILQAMKKNKTLKSLALDKIDLDGYWSKLENWSGLFELIDSFDHSLHTLSLSGNNLGEAGALAFAKSLKLNHQLKKLSLGGNNFSKSGGNDKSVLAIVDSLKDHPSIIHLDLKNNNIGNKGAAALIKLLEVNPRITFLEVKNFSQSLPENSINGNLIAKISELSEKNKEKVRQTVDYLSKYFLSHNSIVKDVDPTILKYFQTCDKEVMKAYLGEEQYKQLEKYINRYIAINFLKLNGCMGNGKSTVTQLSSHLRFKIFSYLDLKKALWWREVAKRQKFVQLKILNENKIKVDEVLNECA